MRKTFYRSILLVTLLSAQQSLAYDYSMSCADKKLTKFVSNSEQKSDDCKTFILNGFSKCFDSRKPNQSSEMITLSTPNDQYYKSKESSRYSRKKIQGIIDSAVKAGNDPYLTLAIVVTENPPLFDDEDPSYAEHYGMIPLDAIGVADTFACDQVQNTYGAKEQKFKNRGPLKRFVIDVKGVDQNVCILKNTKAGHSAKFYREDRPAPDDCCMILKADIKGYEKDKKAGLLPGLQVKLLDLLSHEYMKNRFAYASRRAASEKLPQSKMAVVAQSYNGFGLFGATERMKNQCLHKINMGKTPVYGAGTSEIMLNSLMNNSEISAMVAESLKKQRKDFPVSQLCTAYGSGSHKLSGYSFTNLLQTFIGGRNNCPKFTNRLKDPRRGPRTQVASSSGVSSAPKGDAKKSKPSGAAQ